MSTPSDINVPATGEGVSMFTFWPGFVVTWIGFGLVYGARLHYVPGSQVLWAGVASTGFLLAAWTKHIVRDAYGMLAFLGLVGCWFGDLLGPSDFMTGVYAFFAAHMMFILACWKKGIRWTTVGRVAVPVIAVSAAMLMLILPNTPAQELPMISAYTVLISTMVIAALGAGKGNVPLVLAAITFFISDAFLAFWRFGDSAASGWLCYPFYYAACLLFARSVHVEIGTGQQVRTK